MEAAGSNAAGSVSGFMGMGMGMQAGAGVMGAASEANIRQMEMNRQQAQAAQQNTASNGWTCSCGTVNKGKFCMECGAKKPAEAPLYRCDKCGWESDDPKNPPKFCSECGKPIPTTWTCSCGAVNSGKFCTECGKPAPEAPWTCSCGAVNTGKFCSECGKPKA